MKINRLVLNNLGLYCGTKELKLTPLSSKDSKKNIVLFGGLNGSGKTTMFDAVNLCLYGKEIFPRMSIAGYHDYLKKKIHHSKALLVQPNHASVGLEFEYSQFGEVSTYFIERHWEANGKKTIESIAIKKNGEELKEVRKESWQDFIKQLIPPGLSQLFFFDGEKIHKMMGADNNAEFKNSVKMLLGLDIIERLQADLRIYKTKNLKDISTKKFKKEIEGLESQKKSIEELKKKKMTALAALENDILKIEDSVSGYREKIIAQGNDFLARKDTLNEEKLKLDKDLEIIKDKMRELASGLLPLTIASSGLLKLKAYIIQERKQQTDRLAEEKLREKKDVFMEKISSDDFLPGAEPTLKTLVKTALESELNRLFEPENEIKVKEIFGFSSSQAERLILSIERALNEVPDTLKQLSSEYEEKFRLLREIEGDLGKVPDEAFVKPMFEKLDELNLNLGALLNEKSHLEQEVAAFDNDIAEVERKIDKVNHTIEEKEKDTRKLSLTKKAEKALSTYKRELALRKVENFKNEFLIIFQDLHRKKDLIANITIDPGTFNITLYDSKNAVITKESLSAGEKEIYAIALLTALAKASGQNLPFIIDMPLGRLDSEHRDRIVERFFPYASHQLIVFSTNTEIEKKYFEVLKPNISHSYNLIYDQEYGDARVEEGFFWK